MLFTGLFNRDCRRRERDAGLGMAQAWRMIRARTPKCIRTDAGENRQDSVSILIVQGDPASRLNQFNATVFIPALRSRRQSPVECGRYYLANRIALPCYGSPPRTPRPAPALKVFEDVDAFFESISRTQPKSIDPKLVHAGAGVTTLAPMCLTDSPLPRRCASSSRWFLFSHARRRHGPSTVQKQSPDLFEAPALASSRSRASHTPPPLPQATPSMACLPLSPEPWATDSRRHAVSDLQYPSKGILRPRGRLSPATGAAPIASSQDCLTLNVWTRGEIGSASGSRS